MKVRKRFGTQVGFKSIHIASSPGCSLEGMMRKLKLQYFGHFMWRVDSLEKTLMLGGIGGRKEGDDRGWDGWMASPTQWTWIWVNSGSWWWTGRPGVLWFMESQRVRHDWVTELNWTDTHTHTIFGLCADRHLAWFHFPSTTGNISVVNPAFNSKSALKIAKKIFYSGELANKKYWKCLRGEK